MKETTDDPQLALAQVQALHNLINMGADDAVRDCVRSLSKPDAFCMGMMYALLLDNNRTKEERAAACARMALVLGRMTA